MEEEVKDNRTFGERVSDSVAEFGGSWKFIFVFGTVLIVWVTFNTLQATKVLHFDEYPYVLMNLFLSFIAAFQAPIIMMSQNRHGKKQQEDNEVTMKKLTTVVERIEALVTKDLEIDGEDMAEIHQMLDELAEIKAQNYGDLQILKANMKELTEVAEKLQAILTTPPSIPTIPTPMNPYIGDPINPWRVTSDMISGGVYSGGYLGDLPPVGTINISVNTSGNADVARITEKIKSAFSMLSGNTTS